MNTQKKQKTLLKIGELAVLVDRSVRAIRLYYELGLVLPQGRSEGGFRLYSRDAVDKIRWIQRMQVIGFSLPEIQAFAQAFGSFKTGREAATHVHEIFESKRREIEANIAQLNAVKDELDEAVCYLESCHSCATMYMPTECQSCDHQGHDPENTPLLFSGLYTTPIVNKAFMNMSKSLQNKERTQS